MSKEDVSFDEHYALVSILETDVLLTEQMQNVKDRKKERDLLVRFFNKTPRNRHDLNFVS